MSKDRYEIIDNTKYNIASWDFYFSRRE